MIAAMLPDSVTLASVSARDAGGAPTFGTQSTIKARVERYTKEIVTIGNRRAAATHRIYSETAMAMGDRVWLAEDDTGADADAREILVVNYAAVLGNVVYEAML